MAVISSTSKTLRQYLLITLRAFAKQNKKGKRQIDLDVYGRKFTDIQAIDPLVDATGVQWVWGCIDNRIIGQDV